jgi:hypothetical protein
MAKNENAVMERAHAAALENYKAGCREPARIVDAQMLAELGAMGLGAQFLYDCVDDLVRYGEPSREDCLALAAERASSFREVMEGVAATRTWGVADLPPKAAEHAGVAWLPRIVRKARCFLEGSLGDDVMYGCAGDRAFLADYRATLPGFLRHVRVKGDDLDAALDYLRGAGG